MRKLIIALVACIFLLLLGFAGYRGYKVWKQGHYMTMARGFAAKADTGNELLSLRQVLAVNPWNMEATRMMAALTEAARNPSALYWRQRLLQLNPKSLDDRLALVQTALLFRDFAVATNTLDGVDEAGKKTAAYHNLAGVIAVSLGQNQEAEYHFSECARLEPSNPVPQLNLAVVRLHGSNTLDQAEARIDLKRISLNTTNVALRCQANRELIGDALRFKDYPAALSLATELTQPTNTLFSDKLLRLDVLKAASPGKLSAATIECEREAGDGPRKISQMATWLMTQSSPAAALAWMQSLPPATQTNQPAALLMAQCRDLVKDWNGLQASLVKQNWAELDFIRHGFLCRALRGQKLDAAADAEWQVAVKLAGNQKDTLISLFRLVAQWNWINEGEELLWTIVNRYPDEPWANQALQQALFSGGRTRPLMQLFSLEAQRSPNDLEAQNNLAMTAMLLGAQELNPFDLARKVYHQAPQNPSYASTYAFSLYLQKQYPEALKIMQQLTPAQLSDPGVSGYYGLILQATGDKARAKAYFERAAKAQLLPEERKLFQQAQNN